MTSMHNSDQLMVDTENRMGSHGPENARRAVTAPVGGEWRDEIQDVRTLD
jgi:hypothetical protein